MALNKIAYVLFFACQELLRFSVFSELLPDGL